MRLDTRSRRGYFIRRANVHLYYLSNKNINVRGGKDIIKRFSAIMYFIDLQKLSIVERSASKRGIKKI